MRTVISWINNVYSGIFYLKFTAKLLNICYQSSIPNIDTTEYSTLLGKILIALIKLIIKMLILSTLDVDNSLVIIIG